MNINPTIDSKTIENVVFALQSAANAKSLLATPGALEILIGALKRAEESLTTIKNEEELNKKIAAARELIAKSELIVTTEAKKRTGPTETDDGYVYYVTVSCANYEAHIQSDGGPMVDLNNVWRIYVGDGLSYAYAVNSLEDRTLEQIPLHRNSRKNRISYERDEPGVWAMLDRIKDIRTYFNKKESITYVVK